MKTYVDDNYRSDKCAEGSHAVLTHSEVSLQFQFQAFQATLTCSCWMEIGGESRPVARLFERGV